MPKTGFFGFDTDNNLKINHAKNFVKMSKKSAGLEAVRFLL